ncbi:hydroxyacid dehydrogenase [Ancylobacter sp. MQZ15Z-1]|uniref:Hydroxyacid dehydrogenase n=1 Tax=Ancylobacter mangrovi TaxID=2972472 RepID=A0A9X2T239_9HYPH|nr:hydroxyacid dehydrogenase [Ancylobacter mangrovi]MCS0495785.1 hydroxyacid dehydrogenase [Ancylobacter mangrovi]
MPRCLIVQPIHAAGLELLEKAGITPVPAPAYDAEAIVAAMPGMEAVITRDAGLRGPAIGASAVLRVIGVHGVGTDPVDIAEASRLGVCVVNTPGANVRAVAEQTLALALALAKQVPAADAAARAGDFGFKYRAPLRELAGATFGIVGFGHIGQATAALARAFGMKVAGFSRSQPDEAFARAGVERMATLDALLRVADVVSLHLPSTPATRGVIGARELSLMKPGAFLLNTSRGALIDEEVLVEALAARRIGGAGLDVFALEPLPAGSRLVALDNVVLSPHVAGSAVEALERTARLVAEQVVDVFAGRRPAHLVNPETWPPGPRA